MNPVIKEENNDNGKAASVLVGMAVAPGMGWPGFPAQWMRAHLAEIAFGLTAMALVVGGPYANAGVKNLGRKFPWPLRYALFLFLAVAGYGVISNFVQRHTRDFLSVLSDAQLVAAVLGLHLMMAWLLKRDRKI